MARKNGSEPVILRYLLTLAGMFILGVYFGVNHIAPHC